MATSAQLPNRRPAVGVQRREWQWVLAGAVLVLALTSIPYVAGWEAAAGNPELTFGGFVIGVEDGNSYLAKMAQGARGHWLFRIVYTSEPHDGVLFFLFHILLGKGAALLPGPAAALPVRLIWVYHLSRLICGLGLLAMVYRFVAEFLPTVPLRRLAWLMVALGGGLGWLLLALGLGDWLGSPPLDFILPEGFTFLTVFFLPHVALGRMLLLGGMLVWLKGAERLADGELNPWAGIWAGPIWLLMGLIVPFYPAVAGVVVGATLLAWWAAEQRFPSRRVRLSLIAGLIAAPAVLYSAWVFVTDPVMKGWAAQNLILSPPVPHYLAAYLLPGLLAAGGAAWVWRRRPGRRYWLLVAWVLAVPLLLYAPFNLQRRLIEGYQVPLCTLAVLGADRAIWPRLGRRVSRPWPLAAGLLLLLIPSSLVLVAGSTLAVMATESPIFHVSEEVAVAAWLTENAPEGALVVSDYGSGNFLPGWAPVRSYYGHGPETIEFATKKENVLRFYAAETDDGWRRSFLAANGVRYVLEGPAERALGGFQPADAVYLRPVYRKGDWALYEFAGS
jgi:hypothetical protein